jgi:hyperosmotically inducible periplasmic protein
MRRTLQIYSIVAALAFVGFNVSAQETPRDTTTTHSKSRLKRHMKNEMKHDTTGAMEAPDNTGKNKRDRGGATLTPGDQSNDPQDLEITRKIRSEIIDQDGMSVNARNIKIITVGGRVTLRGPVNTEEEKQRIAEIAAKFANPGSIDNQLEVKHSADRK